jgi:hypothetical protein
VFGIRDMSTECPAALGDRCVCYVVMLGGTVPVQSADVRDAPCAVGCTEVGRRSGRDRVG